MALLPPIFKYYVVVDRVKQITNVFGHWEQLMTAIITKLADWAHEKEYRLTLTGWSDFSEKSNRKLQYHFSDLQASSSE
jgi:hypothetical protein